VVITSFTGHNAFLSNFYPAATKLDGVEYSTLEHAYQAAKSLHPVTRESIRRVCTPASAKRLGRSLQIRPDWEGIKVDVMRSLLRDKFSNPTLRDLLLATGDAELVEGNWWRDTFWGVCQGRGQNMLGKLLMEIRDDMRSKPNG
jgi:ribA/ribD-fused uncharacterized protein